MAKRDFKVESLCISDTDLRLSFRELTNEEKSKTISHGQRKLGMMLFDSLLEAKKIFGSDNFAVVIVGAAPGRNTYAVAKLLKPKLGYFLYDPAGFDISESEANETNIKIFKQLFTDAIADQWKAIVEGGTNVLFISDIRSDIPKATTKEEHINNERIIHNDMLLQQKWVEYLKPGLSVLKFRPYFADVAKALGLSIKMLYLAGYKVCKGIWTHPTSAETRLFVIPINGSFIKKEWDVEKYEDQMFYHNAVNRTAKYKIIIKGSGHNDYITAIDGVPELIDDWDSNAEAYILARVATEWFNIDINSVYNSIIFLSTHMSKVLGVTLGSLRLKPKRRIKSIPFGFYETLKKGDFDPSDVIGLLFPPPENTNLKQDINFRKQDLIHITPYIKMVDLIKQIAFRIRPGSRKTMTFNIIDVNAKIGSSTIGFMLSKLVTRVEAIVGDMEDNSFLMANMGMYQKYIDPNKQITTYVSLFPIMFENRDIDVKGKVVYFSPKFITNSKDILSGITINSIPIEALARKVMLAGANMAVMRVPTGYQVARLKMHQFQVEEYPFDDVTFVFVYNFPNGFKTEKPSKRDKEYIGQIDVKNICSVIPTRATSPSGYGMSFYCGSKDKRIHGKVLSPVMNNTSDRMIFEYAVEDFGLKSRTPKIARGNFLVVHDDIWKEDQSARLDPSLIYKKSYNWIEVVGRKEETSLEINDKVSYNINLVEIAGVCSYLIYDMLPGQDDNNILTINYHIEKITNKIIRDQIIDWFLLRYYFGSPFTEQSDFFIHEQIIYAANFNRFKSENIKESDLPILDISEQKLKERIDLLKGNIKRAFEISKSALKEKSSRMKPNPLSNAMLKFGGRKFGIHMTFSPVAIGQFLSKREGKLDTTSFKLMSMFMGQK